jgi:NitT/TauT family transport system permease protein/sulfonate transport system permease protein
VTLLAALLVLWEISARLQWVVSDNWPPFSDVLMSLAVGTANGELIEAIGSSLGRMARGYAAGVGAGIVLGVLLAWFPPARRTLQPMIELVRPIPAPAVIPPLMFVLGADEGLKIFIVAYASFFPVWINTMSGVMSLDHVLHNVARTFGVPTSRTLWSVVVPASMPHILAGMRVSLALALIVTVVAELMVGSQGIGAYVRSMQFASRAPDMYAAIILLTATGYLLNVGFLWLEARLIFWSRLREIQAAT